MQPQSKRSRDADDSPAKRSWPGDVCHSCGGSRGARRVVTTDELGDPICLVCRSRQLGETDGAQSVALDLIEQVGTAIAEAGLLAPVDADQAWREAVREGVARRRRTHRPPAPTMAEVQEQIMALVELDGAGEEE